MNQSSGWWAGAAAVAAVVCCAFPFVVVGAFGAVAGLGLGSWVLVAVHLDVPTCPPDMPIDQLDSVPNGRMPFCVVVNENHIVLGRIRAADLDRAPAGAAAEDVMEPGPATVRADADLEQTRARLRRRGVPHILVTTPEGELLGALSANPATRARSVRTPETAATAARPD